MNFRRLSLLRPDDICKASLDLEYYPGPGEQITPLRAAFWHVQQEGQLNWKIRVIDGTKHLAAVMADWTPDILVTHWHGECTSADEQSIPGEIAHRLRKSRGDFLGPGGPFLVAQISAGDSRFDGEHDEDYRLREVYDMVIQRPLNFESFPRNVAIGIYNAMHPDSPLQFDLDFRVLY